MAVVDRQTWGKDKERLIVTSDPNGVETAPQGSIAFQDDGANAWQCNGGTSWSAFGAAASGGTGDVTGPGSSTDGDIAQFSGATGKLLADSGVPVAQVPSSGEKAALAGTSGTPAGGNRYVTNDDTTATPTAGKVARGDGSGLLDSWISLASDTIPGRAERATLTEVNDSTDDVRFVTSKTLAARVKVIADDAVITPPALTGDTDDYSPTDFADAALVRMSSTTTVSITGLAAPSRFTVKYFVNVGSNIIKFLDEDTGSVAANRFAINADISMQGQEGVIAIYDTISARWRVTGKHI